MVTGYGSNTFGVPWSPIRPVCHAFRKRPESITSRARKTLEPRGIPDRPDPVKRAILETRDARLEYV
jgi:hypothetical protein